MSSVTSKLALMLQNANLKLCLGILDFSHQVLIVGDVNEVIENSKTRDKENDQVSVCMMK